MIQKGVIEKVIVPSKQKKSAGSSVKCFRLLKTDSHDTMDESVMLAEDVRDDINQGNTPSLTFHTFDSGW